MLIMNVYHMAFYYVHQNAIFYFPLYPSRVYVEYCCISTHKELYLYVVLFKIHKCIFHTLFSRTIRIKASLRNP